MADALHELASEIANDIAGATGMPVCVSDASGKAIVSTGPIGSFCPLIAHEGPEAAPLPARCEGCARIGALHAPDDPCLPRCPNGEDAVRPIRVGGATVGWLLTSLMRKEFPREREQVEDRFGPRRSAAEAGSGREMVERAEKALKLAELPLAAAIAAERRERHEDDLLSQKLVVARIRAGRALEQLAPDSAGRRDLELTTQALDQAIDVIYAFRAAPSAAAEVAAEAADESAGDRSGLR